MKIFIMALMVLPIILFNQNANAQIKTLDVGDNVPSDIVLQNQEGEDAALNGLSGDKGTVIVFHRSAKWCPYCQADYPLLSDKGSETIKAFGIFNTEHKEGSFAYGVPYPAVYVVNKDGAIKGVLREDGYKKRPEVSDILEVIEK